MLEGFFNAYFLTCVYIYTECFLLVVFEICHFIFLLLKSLEIDFFSLQQENPIYKSPINNFKNPNYGRKAGL